MGGEGLRRGVLWASLAWVCVGCFWFVTTQAYHPTRTLAAIVTTSFVTAYALAAFVNHLILIPRYWRSARYGRYATRLAVTMIVLTAIALAIIRVSYANLWGPDADPNGIYKHFAIDLFGMAVHLIVAALVVWVAGWYGTKGRGLGDLDR